MLRIKERVLKMRCEDQKRQQVEQKFDEDEDPFQRYYASVPLLLPAILPNIFLPFTHPFSYLTSNS